MHSDKFGNPVFQEKDLMKLVYQNYTNFENLIVEDSDNIKKFEEYQNIKLKKFNSDLENIELEEFDKICQSDWFIPDEYKNFDIKTHCLNLCQNDKETARVLEELTAFEAKNMMLVLQTLKYLVDTLKQHEILWGVGRGSSVASYVLFLLEVHKIDSIKYNLDWQEFLR
jgi:DNA polymerase III alpha subunit